MPINLLTKGGKVSDGSLLLANPVNLWGLEHNLGLLSCGKSKVIPKSGLFLLRVSQTLFNK